MEKIHRLSEFSAGQDVVLLDQRHSSGETMSISSSVISDNQPLGLSMVFFYAQSTATVRPFLSVIFIICLL